jgi:hypothetical protein
MRTEAVSVQQLTLAIHQTKLVPRQIKSELPQLSRGRLQVLERTRSRGRALRAGWSL